ncbi:bifunctional aminoglycoside phosphotransferase/ATP-binding protein [Rhizobium rhizophilum]|uniref:Aminoglycoside phosphotransferase n=1 Tax=Rhizobium rhizophilum TaxID=1850373 RepID=A0ABY2QNF8_9HYPH|nr:bifunctional aminoglycoside phosphotransferase/ATP-binding protein [Rhizobium rhizophilum]THV09837.1 aminoglycoside phosphotransferase [Rhizobium rhizophilum]
MFVEDQSAAIAFLRDPASHGITAPVEVIETHISLIFLAGDRAYKLKRAVRLPYADFSTLKLRQRYCQAELALNMRTAPEIYCGIRGITRDASGKTSFDGDGRTIDYVVEMHRFAQDLLFDHMAECGQLSKPLMEETAERIADFHKSAEILHSGSGRENLSAVLDINHAAFSAVTLFSAQESEYLTRLFRNALDRHGQLLDERERAGMIRHCHGDLHLHNIFLGPEGPRMFDCIDFNDHLATTDILYDLAFLLTDLWHRDLPDFANAVVNRYLDRTGDDAGYGLFPFLLALRAAIRAHVGATQLRDLGDQTGHAAEEARAYRDLAQSLLQDKEPILIAIGGLSGSGKSTLAEAMAPHLGLAPGARLLESDRLRRAMLRYSRGTPMPAEAYRPDVSAKVYAALVEKAELVTRAGGSVVANAVFTNAEERQAIEQVAKKSGLRFVGLWLEADQSILRSRIETRPVTDSDATVTVLDQQLSRGTGEISWTRLDAGRPRALVASEAMSLLAEDRLSED